VKVGPVRERRKRARARVCVDDKEVNRIGTHVEHPKSHTSTLLIPRPVGLAGPAKDPEVAPEAHLFPLCPVNDPILSELPPAPVQSELGLG
jgi:hypothetical protein